MSLPKVLILIQPFNRNTGGGITLSNLFKGWPKDKIAVLTRGQLVNANTRTDICDSYYQLGHLEYRWTFPFNKLKRKYYSGLLEFGENGANGIVTNKSNLRVALLNRYVNPFLKWTGVQNAISKLELSQQLKDWLLRYNPDVLYAQAQTRESVLFCTLIQKFLNKPMVFHMMDDWVQLEGKGLMGRYWYPKVQKEFRNMLGKSAMHLSISDLMAIEYKRRYGHDFRTFHNPIDLNFWKQGQRNSYKLGDPPTVLYAGRVGLGIEKSLQRMAKAITALNREMDTSIKFILQVSEKPSWTDKYDCVIHRSFVPYEELPIKFAAADILFLPYDFSAKAINFIRYSMPTKASEYMISGTPILICAPEGTAIVDYAGKYGWAKVVTEDNLEVLTAGLKSLLLNQEERQRIAQTAIKLAEDRHDAEKVRADFKAALVSVLDKKSV